MTHIQAIEGVLLLWLALNIAMTSLLVREYRRLRRQESFVARFNAPPIKVPTIRFRGPYDAAANTPSIGPRGSGFLDGDVLVVQTAGTVAADSLGLLEVGDRIMSTGDRWVRLGGALL